MKPWAWKDCPTCGGEPRGMGEGRTHGHWGEPIPGRYRRCPTCAKVKALLDAAEAAHAEREVVAVDKAYRKAWDIVATAHNDAFNYRNHVEVARSENTAKWAITTRWEGSPGTVKWYARWRRYCFFPAPDTVLSADCMTDLAAFIERKMAGRRAKEGKG